MFSRDVRCFDFPKLRRLTMSQALTEYRSLTTKAPHEAVALKTMGQETVLRRIGRLMERFLDVLFPHFFILEGQERHSGVPILVAYAGSHRQLQEYLVKAVFADGFKK